MQPDSHYRSGGQDFGDRDTELHALTFSSVRLPMTLRWLFSFILLLQLPSILCLPAQEVISGWDGIPSHHPHQAAATPAPAAATPAQAAEEQFARHLRVHKASTPAQVRKQAPAV
jgi:hypothetical protein